MSKYSKVFALLKQVNQQGLNLTYQEAVSDLTDGRTESLSSLAVWEVQELERRLMSLANAKSQSKVPEGDEERDRMRKAIISSFLSIGKTAADAIRWAEKYGVNGQKKRFNDYTKAELILLIRNSEKVKRGVIKDLS